MNEMADETTPEVEVEATVPSTARRWDRLVGTTDARIETFGEEELAGSGSGYYNLPNGATIHQYLTCLEEHAPANIRLAEELRLLEHMRPSAIANKLGVDRATIGRWTEKGHDIYNTQRLSYYERLSHGQRWAAVLWSERKPTSYIARTLGISEAEVHQYVTDATEAKRADQAARHQGSTPTARKRGKYANGDKTRAQIAEVIRALTWAQGKAPTFREIKAHMGKTSTNGLQHNLKIMERDGIIEKNPDRYGWRLVPSSETVPHFTATQAQ